ncbi:MAG: hypothetical protein NOU37_04285 [Candidatus Brocadiales bacterium]|nr:hypothetical protein [Candidatus Bathyanammoxibius amoris]
MQSRKHHRRSIRLKGYDYSRKGAYFVTICTQKKTCLFGDIEDRNMVLNAIGQIVENCWEEIPKHFDNVKLDVFVIMPNHLHGIIVLPNDQQLHERRGTACRAPTIESYGKPVVRSLPTIIRSLKSSVTKYVNQLRRTPGSHVWQRNYYEHVIRNEDDLNEIREYVMNNPLKWELDEENPSASV